MTGTGVSAPVPIPDDVSQPFWSAISERRLVVQRCVTCLSYHHPPVVVCPTCVSVDLQFVDVSGRGYVRAMTRTYVAREPYFAQRSPYLVAIVELDESPDLLMVSNFPYNSPGEVEIDSPVEIDFEETDAGQFIPQFRLAARPTC
jgi:uncharacterized OB-fold protein